MSNHPHRAVLALGWRSACCSAACGGDDEVGDPTTVDDHAGHRGRARTPSTTTTTSTGVEQATVHAGGDDHHGRRRSGDAADRPAGDRSGAGRTSALVVKIDNQPEARPQSGLNEADIVFEENVESSPGSRPCSRATRPDPVGPIRSGRTQDIILLGSFNRPLFVWSGGNGRVTAAISRQRLLRRAQAGQSGPGCSA